MHRLVDQVAIVGMAHLQHLQVRWHRAPGIQAVDAKGLFRPVAFARADPAAPAPCVAQLLAGNQIGFAPLKLGRPSRHPVLQLGPGLLEQPGAPPSGGTEPCGQRYPA